MPWLLALLILINVPLCRAQEQDLFALSLFDLSQLTVTVSSYEPERMVETPAIVTRFDVAQMQALGLSDLSQMLSFIPGVTVQDHLFGQPFISVRGVYEGFNQKILFLLDETPYFMSSHSDIPLKGIPLDAISHVEVIRGPGAVYYGTNATAGVVKIVTKQHVKKNSVRISSAQYQDAKLDAIGGIDTEKGNILLAMSAETKHTIKTRYPAYDTFTQWDVKRNEQTQSFLGKYNYKQQHFNVHVFETLYTGFSSPQSQANINTLTYKGLLVSGQYKQTLAGDGELTYFSDYNRFYLNFLINDRFGSDIDGGFRMDGDGRHNYRMRLGVKYQQSINESIHGFLGLETERRSTGAYEFYNDSTDATLGTIMPQFFLDESSLYGQLDIIPYEKGRILLGMRHTNNQITGDSTVPRLAYVHLLNNHSSIKALYSVGFNSPSFTQLKADLAGVVNGNSSLGPETVSSLDLGYYWQGKKLSMGFTWFKFTAEDFIYSDRSTGVIEFFNNEGFSHSGLEFDLERGFDKNNKVFFNVSHLFDGDKGDSKDASAKFSAKWMANAGVNYQLQKLHNLGASIRYVSKRASAAQTLIVNTNYRYHINDVEWSLNLTNLLDETVNYPNMAEFNERLIPSHVDHAQVMVAVKYSF